MKAEGLGSVPAEARPVCGARTPVSPHSPRRARPALPAPLPASFCWYRKEMEEPVLLLLFSFFCLSHELNSLFSAKNSLFILLIFVNSP